MSDVALELLSVTFTQAPLGLRLDAYGFLAAVLDTAEESTQRLRPCDELVGINGTLYDDVPTDSTPDAAAELCDLVGEYVEAGAFPLTLTFRRDPSLMCQPVGACFERRSIAPSRRSSSGGPRRRRTWRSSRSPKRRRTLAASPSPIYASQTSSSSLSTIHPPGNAPLFSSMEEDAPASPGAAPAFALPENDAPAFAPPPDEASPAFPPPDDDAASTKYAAAEPVENDAAPTLMSPDAAEPAGAAPVDTTTTITRRRKKPRRYAEVPDAPASRWAEGSAATPAAAPITPAAPPPFTPAPPAAPVPPVTLSAGAAAAPPPIYAGAAPIAPPPSTPAAPAARAPPVTASATAAAAAGPTVFTKKQLLTLMPGGTGSIVPAVYAAGGVIYALAFSEASNPGLPTVLEISADAQRARQVAVLDELRRNNGVAPLFVCLRTRRGRHECVPGSSCKAFRFAGYRAVVSVERHDPPKLVGGEVRQATITLGAPTAAPCPLTATTPAAAPPPTPAAPPPVLSPVTSQRSASPFLPPAALSPAAPPPVPAPPAATRRRAQTRRYADVPDELHGHGAEHDARRQVLHRCHEQNGRLRDSYRKPEDDHGDAGAAHQGHGVAEALVHGGFLDVHGLVAHESCAAFRGL